MRETRFRVQMNRRSYALAAALVLPLSSVTVVAAVTHGDADATTLAVGAISSRGAFGGLDHAAVNGVAKLAAASEANGHAPVVVGTARERVSQVSATSTYDLPAAALAGYKHAEAAMALSSPGCHLSWTLLAAIGQVESDNGRYGGAVVLANGDTYPHILGPVLNGAPGMGAIADSDGGRYDGDLIWDRAVGPMQFIPGTWAAYGADGNGDGISDPNNIKDAALAAAHYLCAGGGDLRVEADARAAVLTYNHSESYVDLVLRLAAAYAAGQATVVPNGTPGPRPQPAPGPVERPAAHKQPQSPSEPPAGSDHPGGKGDGNGGGGNSTGGGGGNGNGNGGGGGNDNGNGGGGNGNGHGGNGNGGNGNGDDGGNQPPLTPIHHYPVVSNPPTTPPATPPAHHHHPKPGKPGPVQPAPVTGLLEADESGWSVAGVPLDFGADADLSAKVADFDADGRTRTLTKELTSLVGRPVILTVVETADPAATTIDAPEPTDAVTTDDVNPGAAPSAADDPSAVTPEVAPDEESVAVAITVDADGVVTSINGLAYSQAAPADQRAAH